MPYQPIDITENEGETMDVEGDEGTHRPSESPPAFSICSAFARLSLLQLRRDVWRRVRGFASRAKVCFGMMHSTAEMESLSLLSDLHLIEPMGFSRVHESDPPRSDIALASFKQTAYSRLLCFLLIMSCFVIAFQLALGYWSNSLTLLADAGHSGADVITYGVNYVVELLKARSCSGGGEESLSQVRLFSMLDICGCLLTTFLLCVSTWFATEEAIGRLQIGGSLEAREFGSISVALFTFALVSLALNISTLAVYRVYREKVAVAAPSTADCANVNSALRNPQRFTSLSMGMITSHRTQELESFSMSTTSPLTGGVADIDSPPVSSSAYREFREQRRDKRGSRGRRLNLRDSFSHGSASACANVACTYAPCLVGTHASARELSQFGVQGRPSAWMDVLHKIVHPGCGCAAHEAGTSGGRENGEVARANLNVLSAMLHLIADIMRSFTILVVAVLIQARVIVNVRSADAVCALIVATFVLIGSLELVRRIYTIASSSLTRGP
eukprot:TRINITY_DN69183_c0_g1_i1.p1 TRINITY_DN69183_c0_g1~~TRINITY_DN69183_c0_g1_i1.p1  ORF type:complete len:501 (-),score=38.45 TRINITY_DN69183_c0_g1_i1:175-1677(-)